jgi:hypothetical protein
MLMELIGILAQEQDFIITMAQYGSYSDNYAT